MGAETCPVCKMTVTSLMLHRRLNHPNIKFPSRAGGKLNLGFKRRRGGSNDVKSRSYRCGECKAVVKNLDQHNLLVHPKGSPLLGLSEDGSLKKRLPPSEEARNSGSSNENSPGEINEAKIRKLLNDCVALARETQARGEGGRLLKCLTTLTDVSSYDQKSSPDEHNISLRDDKTHQVGVKLEPELTTDTTSPTSSFRGSQCQRRVNVIIQTDIFNKELKTEVKHETDCSTLILGSECATTTLVKVEPQCSSGVRDFHYGQTSVESTDEYDRSLQDYKNTQVKDELEPELTSMPHL